MTLRIANGAGFLGDDLSAPRRLVELVEVDYLTLEYLAELTMSILARQREKDHSAGFARDWLEVLGSLTAALKDQSQLRIVTNAGGVNPRACAQATARILSDAGLAGERIAVVEGDDLLPRLEELQRHGCEFKNLETGQPLSELTSRIVSANAYLGARPIADAFSHGARIVLTGRVADASLTVGPAMHEFGWKWDNWNKLAAATVAGHLIECGAQVTGGYSTSWREFDLHDIGYPIAELTRDGDVTITKSTGSGGAVTRQTVAEQLTYEIGDPSRYMTPDVIADFQQVEIADAGSDRVRITGAAGLAATDTLKVSLAYADGFMSSGQLLVAGRDCVEKARCCAELILQRVANAGFQLDRSHVELLGADDAIPGRSCGGADRRPSEVVLRIAVHDSCYEAVSRFVREFAPLITAGPAGLAGYAVSRASVRPVYAYWPTLVPKSLLAPRITSCSADEWLA